MSKHTEKYLREHPLPARPKPPPLRSWRHGKSGWRVSAETENEARVQLDGLVGEPIGDLTEIEPVINEDGQITGWVDVVTKQPINLKKLDAE
jgi:hypothetical protein